MTTKLERIEVMEHELAALKAEFEKEAKPWPQVGSMTWSLGMRGDVVGGEFTGDKFDVDCHSVGNIFKSEAEAQAELEARKVVTELRACDGWKAFEVAKPNYCLRISFRVNVIQTEFWEELDSGWQSTYFDSKESVKAAIEKVGERRIIKAARWLAMREV